MADALHISGFRESLPGPPRPPSIAVMAVEQSRPRRVT